SLRHCSILFRTSDIVPSTFAPPSTTLHYLPVVVQKLIMPADNLLLLLSFFLLKCSILLFIRDWRVWRVWRVWRLCAGLIYRGPWRSGVHTLHTFSMMACCRFIAARASSHSAVAGDGGTTANSVLVADLAIVYRHFATTHHTSELIEPSL